MKKGKYIFLIFLFFFILVAATIVAFIYSEFRRPPDVRTNSYLEIELLGPLPEFSAPDFLTSLLLGPRPLSVHDLWMNFRKAKVDRRIRCILLRLGYLECDWAKISEIREAILDFRESGKKVYGYIEEAPDGDKEYYLATACDRIILHPLGWLGVNGIGGWVPFFKSGLDKLGVEAEYEQVEEFKTAAHMFTEKGLTEAHRTELEAVYEDIFGEYVRTIAAARKKTEEEIRTIIDRGLFQGESALDSGLVDDLLYEDEVGKLLREEGRGL
ncbi:MAG: S49 family peptidase, partial [Acidobacteriota bacterium]